MILTDNAIAHIRATIAESPLKEGELRRVAPMGNLFVAEQQLEGQNEKGEIKIDDMTYWLQYVMKIDKVTYYFYGGASVDSANTA